MTFDLGTAKCYHLRPFILPLYSIADLSIPLSQMTGSINDTFDDIPLPLDIETPQKEMLTSGSAEDVEEACFEIGASQLMST